MSIKCFWFFYFILFLVSCKEDKVGIQWIQSFQAVGTSSSPKCIDLNEDGVLDCVIGAGLNEFDSSDTSVIAINGKDGSVLWAVGAQDQMIGSPVFLQLTDDSIQDVVIGGRGAQLLAINGNTGDVLWQFSIQGNEANAIGFMRFNFYTPQVIDDINTDGVQDLLVSNGGNFSAEPYTGNSRYPGVLGIIDGATGEILHVAEMPDKKETYMSPVYLEGNKQVIFGSGGETIGGCLYQIGIEDILSDDLSSAIAIMCKQRHGFMSPPTITDVNIDGVQDIVVNWHGGEMIAINGKDHTVIWSHKVNESEVYASPTPAYINDDRIPDFFSHFSFGKWPKYSGAAQHIINGKTGELLYADSLGCGSFSTALSMDSNKDGFSEILFSTNSFECSGIYLANTTYNLVLWDPVNAKQQNLIDPITAKNLFSTPWLGDLDGDSQLDLLVCIQTNYNDPLSYYGIQLFNLQLPFQQNSTSKSWTEYLGANHNGTF